MKDKHRIRSVRAQGDSLSRPCLCILYR